MRTILSYPNKKNLAFSSALMQGSNFCNFLKEYDFSKFDKKLQILYTRLEINKNHIADLQKIKTELTDDTKFILSNWGQASLHLMIMIKHFSKLTLDLIPQAQGISKLQEIAYEAVEEIENDGFKTIETKDVILDSLEEAVDKYKPIVTVMRFIDDYVTETIEKQDDLDKFQIDMKNQFSNLEKEIKHFNTEIDKLTKNQKALLKLKEEINNYISINCNESKMKTREKNTDLTIPFSKP